MVRPRRLEQVSLNSGLETIVPLCPPQMPCSSTRSHWSSYWYQISVFKVRSTTPGNVENGKENNAKNIAEDKGKTLKSHHLYQISHETPGAQALTPPVCGWIVQPCFFLAVWDPGLITHWLKASGKAFWENGSWVPDLSRIFSGQQGWTDRGDSEPSRHSRIFLNMNLLLLNWRW